MKVRDPNRLHSKAFIYFFSFIQRTFGCAWACYDMQNSSPCVQFITHVSGVCTQILSSIRRGVSFLIVHFLLLS